MNPDVWGPHAWIFLHSVSLQYPSQPSQIEKTKHREWLTNLKYVIPCQKCRNHYSDYISRNPPNLNSKKEFVDWVWNLHNDVNSRSNKKLVSMDSFLSFYQKLFKRQIKIKVPAIPTTGSLEQKGLVSSIVDYLLNLNSACCSF